MHRLAGAAAGATRRGGLAVPRPVRDGRPPRPARPHPAGTREPGDPAYLDWCERHADWLDPYVDYLTVRTTLGGRPWPEWEPALRDRDPQRVADVVSGAPVLAERVRSEQWRFAEQWARPAPLRRGARRPAVRRRADLRRPRQRRRLGAARPVPARRRGTADGRGRRPARLLQRTASSGATRSTTGRRMASGRLRLVDRAAAIARCALSTWSGSTTSAASRPTGRSRPTRPTADERPVGAGPGRGALRRARGRALGGLPLIAEDLGVITAEVERCATVRPARHEGPPVRLRRRPTANPTSRTTTRSTASSTPARTTTTRRSAGGDRSPTTPATWSVLYWSTRGSRCPGRSSGSAHASGARLAVVPAQDLLGLGGEARMNTPGVPRRQLDLASGGRRLRR